MSSNEASREQFVDFLLEAKRRTYAGQGDEATVTPLVPGSKQLEHRDGDYLYRDIYFGMAYFVGQEVVFRREQAVWSMSYAGGVMPLSRDGHDTRAIYAFLRLALRHGGQDAPYRGPAAFTRDALTYTNATDGSLTMFSGVEAISREGAQLYECRYAGGLLR